jgi:hypothetical protein
MRGPVTAAIGVFLLVGAVYALAGPGRIDMIDGQYRFEIARNIIERGSVQIYDPYLGGVVGVNGVYSSYGVAGSVVAMPMILLGKVSGTSSVDREQFFFSFTSAVFGAAAAAVLFIFYTRVGVSAQDALFWTFVSGFATLTFPQSLSVFDQVQHGFFLLAACFLGWLGARRDSMGLTIGGGMSLAILVNFQEVYAILLPTLGLVTLASPDSRPVPRRRAVERFVVFVFVGCLGLLFYGGFNNFRYGSLVFSGKGVGHPSPLGNPLLGLPGLLVSPGKSIFLYSPPTAMAFIGVYRLLRSHRYLGLAIAMSCIAYLGLISMLSFYGGDWCWGPRYFVTILPLTALGFPFAAVTRRFGLALVITGLCVQLLAISLDHHRFFYSRSLPAFFWHTQRSFYFRDSALLARPGEILESIRIGVPPEATVFRPGPYPELLTYAVFGGWGDRGLTQPLWMRHYRVFWEPRPWPLWMRSIPADRRPVELPSAVVALLLIGVAGAWTIRSGLRGASFSGAGETRRRPDQID